jgi:hypothetical protein
MKQTRKSLAVLLVVVLALVFIAVAMVPAQSGKDKYKFDNDGNLIRPEGYRLWVYIGTPVTPNSENGGKASFPDFHNVYIHPADFEHYKKTGKFQDGTILIKELVSVGSTRATSGVGHFMGEFTGLEATIKDKKKFPEEPGNWAYFSFGHEYPLAETVGAFPAVACNSCHATSAADDWVFTQYYPILRAVKGGSSAQEVGMRIPKPDEGKAAMGAMESAMQSTFGGVPTSPDALFAYVKAAKYKDWAHESEVHKSRGPHFDVKTYLNAALDKSMKAGNDSHPKGAASVKEMYENGKLKGWAVSVKTQADSDNGKGWYWYEVVSTTDASQIPAEGKGAGLCVGCHFPGKDFVLTGYPLK